MAHGRKRIILGIGLLAFTCLSTSIIIASRKRSFWIERFTDSESLTIAAKRGFLQITRFPHAKRDKARPTSWGMGTSKIVHAQLHFLVPDEADLIARTRKFWFRLGYFHRFPHCDELQLAGWPLPLASALLATLSLQSGVQARRRSRSHLCPKCSYDLSSIPPPNPCPECGQVPPSLRATSARGEVPAGR